MKIGLVLSRTPTYSETFFNSKIKGLQQSGFEVTLFVQKKAIDFELCHVVEASKVFKKNFIFQFVASFLVGFKLLKYSKRVQKFVMFEREVHRSWKQILKNIYNNSHLLRADLDWLHFGFTTLALQSEHVAKSIEAKMAVSLRGFDIDVYPLKHPNCYDLIWKNVTKVHSISNYLLQSAFMIGLSKHTPFQIITPAIDVSKFKNVSKMASETLQFLTIGRLHWIKGMIHTLEALVLLKRMDINFNYKIIGNGPEYENIAFAIQQLKLTEQVKLVGEKAHDEIANYLSVTNVYIQYSESEGFCNAVLEAQAMGLLCIVSDGGALPENVLDEETGWIVPKNNPKLLAKKIFDVVNLPEVKKEQFSNSASKRVKEQFNLVQQQQAFVKFYDYI